MKKRRKSKKTEDKKQLWFSGAHLGVLVALICAVIVAFGFHRIKERVHLHNNALTAANEANFLKRLQDLDNQNEERRGMFVNVERAEPKPLQVQPAPQDSEKNPTDAPVIEEKTREAVEVTTNAYMKTFKTENCLDKHTLMDPGQPRIAISSFPGSGNTWARHLLHMATGHWTGNARSSQKLKDAGWEGEDENCMEGTTIELHLTDSIKAIKTHKWHTFKKCAYDGAILIVRNPFHALIAEFNRQMAGSKIDSLEVDLYKSMGWEKFLVEYSRDYFNFFNEWFSRFNNPITVVCFEEMVQNPVEATRSMLDFLHFPDFRLDCINENLEGDFHREHHVHSHHVKIYSEEQTARIKTIINKISVMLARHHKRDCTKFFNYTNVQYY